MSFFDAMAADDVTLHGLEKWTCNMYEQLGWITLANESGREDKVGTYLTSIKKLKNSIESRLKIITSEDARLDLDSLLSKVKHLIKITNKLFSKEHIRKIICDKCALPIKKNNLKETEETEETEETNETDLQEVHTKSKLKQSGGNIKSSKSKMSKLSKSSHLNKLSKLSKRLSKKSSKKLSKKLSKKTSKKTSKKMSRNMTQKKKSSKKPSKKISKINVKKIKSTSINKNNFEPLIKKLSKKSSKKSSKNKEIFKKKKK